METRVALLKGRALDYAVALAEDLKPRVFIESDCGQQRELDVHIGVGISPIGHLVYSVELMADDIIDRERISTEVGHSGIWLAYQMYNVNNDRIFMSAGQTRREAAMRCFIRMKLGEEVEVPEELM